MSQLNAVTSLLRGIAGLLLRLAVLALVGVAALALLLGRDGFGVFDAVLTAVLLAPSAIVLVFVQGVRELLALPERVRRLPGEGGQRLADLTRLAGEARTTKARGVPLLLWRLRGTVGSVRDLAGIALPLRVLTPQLLGLTAVATLACIALTGAGLVALLVLAVG